MKFRKRHIGGRGAVFHMIQRLRDIRKKTGISVSEIIREAVRRLLQEVDETGSINLKIK
jgi:Arc/MetJ-type ribon-helix-helix transcriptional regulator